MPRNIGQWQQLESLGFKSRFSCCYPEEHIFSPIPSDWHSREVSLPDHRFQEPLTTERLTFALKQAEEMFSSSKHAMYLHCFAGQERSSLLAIGLLCILEKKNLYDSLAYIRNCNKLAKPLYEHLALLEEVVKAYES